MHKKNQNTKRIGAYHEQKACEYLKNAGLLFHAANVVVGKNEIDLIMQDAKSWVFIEVKFRHDACFGGALATISIQKQKKLLYAADLWLLRQGKSLDNTECRFDVVAITNKELKWIKNAFSYNNF